MTGRLVVATRRSPLALAQCRGWIESFRARYPEVRVEELHVSTTGDRVLDRPLAEIGGKGLFIKEIEEAVLDGRADVAVHSMKDVPPEVAAGLTIACIPERGDARDAAVVGSGVALLDLPAGAVVGTSSLRRKAQLLARRPDLVIRPLRGNVGTRLRKCAEGQFGAVILAYAGLMRLGLADHATEVLEPEVALPAVGQGALGVQCRSDDTTTLALIRALNHPATARLVAAERGVMQAVGGDCRTPTAAYAVRQGDELFLRAMLAEPDCSNARFVHSSVAWPEHEARAHDLGLVLGQQLTARA